MASIYFNPPTLHVLEYIPTVSVNFPTADVYTAKKFPTVEDLPLLHEDKIYSEIQQYLQHEHYAPWEVIEFDDSYKAPPEETAKDKGLAGKVFTSTKKKERTVAITAEDIQKRKNDVKDIVSHLEFMDVPIEQDDLNQKFLTSLAPKWLVYTIVWRNRDDLDTMSLDDVYNHLKVYEPEIDDDDIEEMDIKWNLALLSMRTDRFWKKTGKKITIQGSDITKESRQREERESYKKDPKVEEPALKAIIAIDGIGWDWSYMAEEDEASNNHALVADEEDVPTEYALMAKSSSSLDNKDNGFSRHMTGNISYLSEYEPFNRGYVSFGHGRGKITCKGLIKTDKLEFENVYFVEELKYNLFSVSQICDNKNSVMFTDTECLVLGKNFKLVDDKHVLLRTPRQHNMYTIDLKNVVFHKNLICLIAKALVDESMLWHTRLGHLNFKTMNKLVWSNMVKGLPSKSFENDHSCIACLKEKQHKASCKSKLVNYVSQPLHTLHMDLFGPTSVNSLNHKWKGIKRESLVMQEPLSRTVLLKEEIGLSLKQQGISSTNISAAKKDDAIPDNNASQKEKEKVNRDKEVPERNRNSNPTASTKVSSNDSFELTSSSTVETEVPTVSTHVPTCSLSVPPVTSSVLRIISKGGSSYPEPLSLGNAMSFENRLEDFFGDTSDTVSLNDVEADLSNMETTIQCLSPKSTSFNDFSSNIATALVCLATNRTYNFSKMIFDDETSFPTGDARYREAFFTVTSLDAGQDKENIAKTSAMPHEASPRVTYFGGGEGKSRLLRIMRRGEKDLIRRMLQTRKEGIDQWEDLLVGDTLKDSDKSADKESDNTDDMANVLGTLGAANILVSRGLRSVLTTASLSVATASTLVSPVVTTASGSFPTAVIFTTASVVTSATRVTGSSKGVVIESSSPMSLNIPSISKKDKGKGKMTEPEQPSKEEVLEQMSAQLARDLEAKFAQEDQIIRGQAKRDSKIARIHAERELKMMIAELDRSNEIVAKYLSEYEQVEAGLSHDKKVELMDELLMYQMNLAQIKKY
uniref:Putative ribonuclease H-like domain-containing protein n=1 Tax=Tanacetum cinerariifolium TaxID=118510 RepID=A0A6L2NKM2_TANCI|nr:putative ribonuclease H-like domain-containing protein [Tanacetum cinerariifolium]